MESYESILAGIALLEPSSTANERELMWVHDAHVVGVSRTADGAVEIFLAGERLVASTPVVRRTLVHDEWHRKGGEPLSAGRLVLPKAGHFDQVAAFICTELLRNGAGEDLQAGFAATEAVIALAIESLLEDDSWLRGLLGEVLLLEAMLRNAPDALVSAVLAGWNGYEKSLRDFTYGPAGIEVKTTTRKSSSHKVEGVHQVELQGSGSDDDGQGEESLLLVSVGIRWAKSDDGDYGSAYRLPALIDAVADRCEAALGDMAQAQIDQFLTKVQAYGASASGYVHATMAEDPFYAKPFQVDFVRGYDMLDPHIQILGSDDIAKRPNTVARTVTFSISLPDSVDGDINPVSGLNDVARLIAAGAC